VPGSAANRKPKRAAPHRPSPSPKHPGPPACGTGATKASGCPCSDPNPDSQDASCRRNSSPRPPNDPAPDHRMDATSAGAVRRLRTAPRTAPPARMQSRHRLLGARRTAEHGEARPLPRLPRRAIAAAQPPEVAMTIVALDAAAFRDIPRQLRELADDIDDGHHPDLKFIVAVLV